MATERCERDFFTLALRVNNSNEIRVRRVRRPTKVYGKTYTCRSGRLVGSFQACGHRLGEVKTALIRET